jgi:transcriptional regulator with AAA-type ATPase domain
MERAGVHMETNGTMPGATGAATTLTGGIAELGAPVPRVPGAVLIFASSAPAARFFRLDAGVLELGRAELAMGSATDALISRRHVRISSVESGYEVADLGSRNGTWVNGRRLTGELATPAGSLVRIGGALLLLVEDLLPFEHYGLGIRDGIVAGPSLRRALESVARLAQGSSRGATLLITGETGTGKEIAAQTFHGAHRRPDASFMPVNCATMPKELAERLLFGSRRGAFSGATDAPGYVQSAQGGTLFLDEVAELPLEVQSKLLRIIETREVLRLGATRHELVELRLCAATWRDLRSEVTAGRFREDLYFRIGQPEVRLPPLRHRIEEVPWHIHRVLEDVNAADARSVTPSAGFVEACALRHWPGNIRELRSEVRSAAAELGPATSVLGSSDLSQTAGVVLAAGPAEPLADPVAASAAEPPSFPEDAIAEAMRCEAGNVTSAARRLGIHRNKVRRWLERHQIDTQYFKRWSKRTRI